jgi:arylsulfatase A-like enzyme
MERLKKNGLYDDAIIVVTADHGTGLKDHGVYGGFEPYEEQIRVPLVIKAPGFPAGLHVETPTVGMDLVPTLVSFFHPGTRNPYDGFSLMDLMAGKRDHLNRRYLLSLNAFRDSMAMLDLETGYKLHLQRKGRYEMLYHLPTDPKELKNLADAQPKQVERMLRTLAPILWHRRHGYGNPFHYRPLEMPNWLHF